MIRMTIMIPATVVVPKAKEGIPRTWILLDNKSTIDLFCNSELLTWICHYPGFDAWGV